MEENEIPLENSNGADGIPAGDDNTSGTDDITNTDSGMPLSDTSNAGGVPAGSDTDNSTNTDSGMPLGNIPIGGTDGGMPLGDTSNGMGGDNTQGGIPVFQNNILQSKKVYKDCKVISITVTGF